MSRNAPIYTLIRWLSRCASCLLLMLAAAETPAYRPASATAPPRARVVIVEDAGATSAFKPREDVVRALVQRGITTFASNQNASAAWRQFVSTQDVIGLKVFSAPGPQVGTRLAVAAAVIEGLLAAKIPTNHIIIWDRQLADLRRAGFDDLARHYGVKLAGAIEAGWDENVFYDTALLGQLVYGDLEFQKKGEGVGRKSFVSKLLTKEITKIINLSPLLNHNTAGVCGNLYGLALGSVDNTMRFEGSPARLAQAVPEIYALPALGDRVVLNIVDALICQYQGEEIGRLHDSAELNQLRFSKDPVALDVLSVQEINAQRQRSVTLPGHTNRMELYQFAALLELGTDDARKIDVQSARAAE